MRVQNERTVADGPREPTVADDPPERTVADALRLAVRAIVYAVLGGAALLAIATVVSVLGPMLAIDLYTPPVAAWWTVFTAVAVQGVPFLLLGTVVSAAIGAFVPERVFTKLLPATRPWRSRSRARRGSSSPAANARRYRWRAA